MHSSITPVVLALSVLSLNVVVRACESYGVDFQNGGSYFQNISSADPFTFVSIYENCEADVATNILVDQKSGDEWLCSDTPLQPDDVEELSTCPLNKNQMSTGRWAVVILSNNGAGEPIAYERDFSLVVGVPATTTFTPTISVTVTSTPLLTTTSLRTTITTDTSTKTTVLPAETKTPTVTITPKPVTSTKVFGPTLKLTAYDFAPIVTTKTATKTCSTSTQPDRDPTLTWRPSILPTKLSRVAADLGLVAARDVPVRRRDSPLGRRVPFDRTQRIAERKERIAAVAGIAIEKRAPDISTTTITNTNSAEWITSTSTALAPTATIIITSVITQTQIITTTNTVYSGTTILPPKTTTLPMKTITKLKPTIFTTTVTTITKKPLFTITIPKDDPAATKACTLKGGKMV